MVIAFIAFDYVGTRLIVDVNGGIYHLKNTSGSNPDNVLTNMGLSNETFSVQAEEDIFNTMYTGKSKLKTAERNSYFTSWHQGM